MEGGYPKFSCWLDIAARSSSSSGQDIALYTTY